LRTRDALDSTRCAPARSRVRGFRALLALLLAALALPAVAGGLDRRLDLDEHGIWDESVQDAVLYSLIGAEIAGALWMGGDTRVGRVLWQSIDASAAGVLTSEVTKRVFTRVRPRDADDPDLWFEGGSNDSFPSGSMIAVTSIVTPFVLEYRKEQPAIYALELLPLYMAVGRLKTQAHWQTDVIAGFAIGTTLGVLAHRREHLFVLDLVPDGVMVGVRKRF
jgi:membrane-associated phospholipid phosphatase